MGRRQFTAEFKTKIVLEILREEKPIGDITKVGQLTIENDCSKKIWASLWT